VKTWRNLSCTDAEMVEMKNATATLENNLAVLQNLNTELI
jgi:hypothetical protein